MKAKIVVIGFMVLFGCFLLEAVTLQEMYNQAEPGAGYDRLVELDPDVVYTGGLKLTQPFFYEDFESGVFPPEGWNLYSYADETTWYSDENTVYSGENSVAHYTSESNSSDWLVLPQISISEPCYLMFFEKNERLSGTRSVLISTGSGNPYDGNFQLLGSLFMRTDWKQRFLDLSDYVGENIYIAFRYIGASGGAWYIDDVGIGYCVPNEKVKIVGNGAVVNLDRKPMCLDKRHVVDIDGVVLREGTNPAIFVLDSAQVSITNSVLYDNVLAIQDYSPTVVEFKNMIMAYSFFQGYRLGSTFYMTNISYSCAFDNGDDGNQHYLYDMPG